MGPQGGSIAKVLPGSSFQFIVRLRFPLWCWAAYCLLAVEGLTEKSFVSPCREPYCSLGFCELRGDSALDLPGGPL